jgi:hypothetical protein
MWLPGHMLAHTKYVPGKTITATDIASGFVKNVAIGGD